MSDERELQAVAERYDRRAGAGLDDRHGALHPAVWQMLQERQRALLRQLVKAGFTDLATLRLTEVGCGAGGNLLELLRLGFAPDRLRGIELLPQRHARARHALPVATELWLGDAAQANVASASQDLVLQSTVFSSLLDDGVQQRLADAMWRWLRPGGAVVWYDFTVDNPRNRDVRGVPRRRVQVLFPQGRITARRLTLAPPLARTVCRVHPGLYIVFNALPLLRTHLLAWIEKPP